MIDSKSADPTDSNHAVAELAEDLRPELDEALLALDELALEDPAEALQMFESLPEPVQALAEFQLTLARAHQALEQLEVARDLTLGVIAAHPDNADAHHLAGDILEDLGDEEAATRHFLRTLALDGESQPEDTSDGQIMLQIGAVASDTLAALPAASRPRISVRPLPSERDVQHGVDPRALCRLGPGEDQHDTLYLYTANLLAEYGDLEEFQEFLPHVREQIQEDIVAYQGLSEAEASKIFGQEDE